MAIVPPLAPTTSGDFPSIDQIVSGFLQIQRQILIRNGVSAASAVAATAKGTDRWADAYAVANAVAAVFANNRVKEDAFLPDSAGGADLVRLARVYGVAPSPGAGASGNVIIGASATTTFTAGAQATSKRTGKRYQVITATTVSDGGLVPMVGIDVGSATNLPPGEQFVWTSPPPNANTVATVDASGLTGGVDADNDAGLRKRLQKRLSAPQSGGSWGAVRLNAETASASVYDAFVYPAAQGPGTSHVAYVIAGTRDNAFARAGSSALTTLVANAITSNNPEYSDGRFTTVAHLDLLTVFKLTLPEPLAGGGVGGGWVDKIADRWPLSNGGTGPAAGLPVKITAVNASTFTVQVSSAPTLSTTRVSFFDSTNRVVLGPARIVGIVVNGGGSYTVTTDIALPSLVNGDYMFPSCERASAYSDFFQGLISKLAPGEKLPAGSVLLPRAYRHPRSVDGFPSGITTAQIAALIAQFTEVSVLTFGSLGESTTPVIPYEPVVPGSVTNPPNIWRTAKLAFYP